MQPGTLWSGQRWQPSPSGSSSSFVYSKLNLLLSVVVDRGVAWSISGKDESGRTYVVLEGALPVGFGVPYRKPLQMTFGDPFLPVVYSRGASGTDRSGAATGAGSGIGARGKGAACRGGGMTIRVNEDSLKMPKGLLERMSHCNSSIQWHTTIYTY